MALPAEQQQYLNDHLQVHADRLDTLRSQQEHIECEIAIHELVLRLGHDERLLAVLGELAEDPTAARNACDDPYAHFTDHGITLPDEIEVSARQDGDDLVVRATYVHDLYPFELTWSPTNGFGARAVEARGKTTS